MTAIQTCTCSIIASALFALGGAGAAHAEQTAAEPGALQELSLEQLSDIEVTSVSGRAQPVGEAPAAVFVITADDIERAGVRTVPGALRLAPNLQVARLGSADYGITARGFNQSSGTANKLLVLVDGRVVYTPLFSGVFWDEQTAIMEDLDRIEVISGPGGTLWGSNAVNGVINVVSRDAHETTGLLVTGGGSENTVSLGARYGTRFGNAGAVRVYGLGLERGLQAAQSTQNMQGGFRSDWSNSRDSLTLQGDIYDGGTDKAAGAVSDTGISGGNLIGRWSRRMANGSAFQVQTSADRTFRKVASGIRAKVEAAAIDGQYTFDIADDHHLIVGAGARITDDTFTRGPGTAYLDPASRTLRNFSGFVQDTVNVSDTMDFILGLKIEHNSYTGTEYLPSARIAWRPTPDTLAWASVSRAVRTPSRFDRDLIAPGVLTNGTFGAEDVIAYELGYRAQPTPRFWFSASTFYNVYNDLRTLEATTATVYPLVVRNGMSGDTYGAEVWGALALSDFWRLNFGATALQKDLKIDAGSTDVTGVNFAGNDPEYQLTLRSLVDISSRAQLDLTARHIAELPSPQVDAYTAVDLRFGYQLTDDLEVAVAGYNLLDDSHVEFVNPSLPVSEQSRSFFVSARWRH